MEGTVEKESWKQNLAAKITIVSKEITTLKEWLQGLPENPNLNLLKELIIREIRELESKKNTLQEMKEMLELEK